jgi:hypothetical protein
MIYRKGEGQMDADGVHTGLRKRALDQSLGEISITRGMTSKQLYEKAVASGLQGAKNAVNLSTTVHEANNNPDMLGGPVSGAALAKLKAKKVEAKKTHEKEMKRR